jgi:ribokinase
VSISAARFAVVGHVEWVEFAHVERVPVAGEVVHARDPFDEPAGGGAVAAVQLARLAGSCTLFTVLGDDEQGRRSAARLAELGVEVRASISRQPTRRAVTLLDDAGERTITTFGPRLDPSGADASLRWEELVDLDAVYFTAGDGAALALARAGARTLVASPRARKALGGGVALDALVLSGEDEIELAESERAVADAEVVVHTEGERGGRWRRSGGEQGRWRAAALPGPIADTYGCGDSFAAGLTYALGAGLALEDGLALAARCGAACLTGAGPYGGGLRRLDDPAAQK